MISVTTQQAAAAAKKILGFYPEIPASDPQGFAAGLVQTLLIFPQAVIDRAVDPVVGIPAKVKFLNLATIRKHLDDWADEYRETRQRHERAARKALPEPPEYPEMKARLAVKFAELQAHLRRGFSPSTAPDEATGERIAPQSTVDAA